MDLSLLKKIIDYYGEENILGFIFDNSGCKLFINEKFVSDTMIVEEIESLQFIEFDIKSLPYHVIKPIETIQTVLIKHDGFNASQYDYVSLGR